MLWAQRRGPNSNLSPHFLNYSKPIAIVFYVAITTTAFGESLPLDSIRILQEARSAQATNQAELTAAWIEVSQSSHDDLPKLLDSFHEATPTGINWLSSAIDRVLERATAEGKSFPADHLAEYVLETKRTPLGRETALNLLREQDEELAKRTVDKLLADPAARLRRPAVTALLKQTEGIEDDQRRLENYQKAFEHALDEDHVVASAVALRKAGQPVDHIRKFGLLMHWQVIGPFDFEEGKGFDTAYPPETLSLESLDGESGIYSKQEFAGKEGNVAWQSFVNTARNGEVDLNEVIGELRDVVAYGATVFESDKTQDVLLRLRQQNSAKMWLNGNLVFDQPIGHTGNFFDQYSIPVTLRKGPNLIVIKSCQTPGPVFHPFVKTWHYCVRVTDETGNAILAVNRPPTPELDALPTEEKKKTDDSEADETKANNEVAEPKESDQ